VKAAVATSETTRAARAFDAANLRAAATWGLHVLALATAAAFVSYVPLGYEGDDAPSANVVGGAGRALSWLVVESFGAGAFALPFYLVFLSLRLRTKTTIADPLLKALGLPMLLFTFGLVVQTLLPGRALARTQFPVGGVLGHYSAELLSGHFGKMWATIAAAVGLAASLILTTDSFLIEFFLPSAKKRGAKKKAERQDGGASDVKTGGAAADPSEPTETDARARADLRKKRALALEAESPAFGDVVEADDVATPETTDAPDADPEFEATDAPADRPARKRRKSRAKSEPDADADVDAPEPTENAVFDDDADADADDADADDDAAAEPETEQKPLPFKPPTIRDLAAPAKKDPNAVTVINLSRDPKLKGKEKYDLPPLALLTEPKPPAERETDEQLQEKALGLMEALGDFGVSAQVEEVVRGPVITRYDLNLERGTRISRVTSLAEDLAMSLGVPRVRIAQVRGKSALGVEIPNRFRETVWLREIALAVTEAQQKKIAIPLFLGKDSSGRPIIEDLATMPHLLVAGRTGAGKSVFINSLILSILLTRYPEEVRLIMVDPKKVELEVYQDVPHLLTRVESDPKKAQAILDWAVQQMEERYALLSCTGVRHLRDYNKMERTKRTDALKKHYSDGEIEKLPDTMPYVVIIVDELADLMMASGRAVEQSIARLAQKARAVGIHVVVATQRPSVDVITGLIKANMPSRIAFQTKSAVDSRTILDSMGAEKLLDKGDMLYSSSASGDAPMRAQGPFVSDDEVHAVVDYLVENAAPMYTHHLIQVGAGEARPGEDGGASSGEDERFTEAVEAALEAGQISTSWLQRTMGLGYARAGRIVDRMTELGYLSGPNGSKPRDVLISRDQWNEMKAKAGGASSAAEA
jgi:DNA segregation ATPase FtsK/SpoIIIE, S-DNA-T family